MNDLATAPPNGSPLPSQSRLPKSSGPRRITRLLSLVGLVVGLGGLLYVVASATGMIRGYGGTARVDLIVHRVGYDKLQLTITERGTLESADNKEIICRVKARSANSTVATTIRWVIDDGTEVQKGDKLIQLDDSGLFEQLKQQRILVDQAYAAFVSADTNYSIVDSQNKSDTAKAKLDLELAEIALKEYKEGEFLKLTKEIEGRRMIAQSDLAMWEERSAWSMRMSKPGRGYVTSAQAQADEARLKSARIALSKVEDELNQLKIYTGERVIKENQGKVDEAKRAVDRVLAQSNAKEVQAEADRKAKKSIYEQEQLKYQDIEEEIKKCSIVALHSGLVVYYVSEQSKWGAGSQQGIVAQGEPVREGQKLMRIPDLNKMVVNTKVHEAMISRVRGERWQKTGYSDATMAGLLISTQDPWARFVAGSSFEHFREDFSEANKLLEQNKLSEGLPAQVRIDAFPERVLNGEVKSVATVASQQDWSSADVKVYQTFVSIKDSVPGLKPGMSAEVTIFTDGARENCLVVPVQAILGSVDMGDKRVVFVQTAGGVVERREVTVGLSNDKMAEIVSGLEENETVVVNPRVLLNEKERAALGDSGPYRYNGGGAEGKGKGKGKEGKGKGGKGKGGPPKDGFPKDGPPAGGPGANAPG